jgi:hypothetical protein
VHQLEIKNFDNSRMRGTNVKIIDAQQARLRNKKKFSCASVSNKKL